MFKINLQLQSCRLHESICLDVVIRYAPLLASTQVHLLGVSPKNTVIVVCDKRELPACITSCRTKLQSHTNIRILNNSITTIPTIKHTVDYLIVPASGIASHISATTTLVTLQPLKTLYHLTDRTVKLKFDNHNTSTTVLGKTCLPQQTIVANALAILNAVCSCYQIVCVRIYGSASGQLFTLTT